jgi:LacI family transcriptional regulator/LacI family repressor for deo operon, udp, cdd, tsx, nupC, and nupG
VTIKDVAEAAGVSKATVSAVLNDKASVSEATRVRVQEVMERLDYRPVPPGGGRGQERKRRSIGLVIKEMDNPYYQEIAAGALAEGRKHGYVVLVTSSEGRYDAEKDAVELLREQGVDGLLVTPVLDEDTDLSHLFELKRRNFPFVLLEAIPGLPANLIDVDSERAMQRVTNRLLEQGHTRVVHFAGPPYSMHTRERIRGVERAFSGSHVVFTESMVVPAGAHLEDGYRAGLAYFGELPAEQRPTAVTCYNDLVALGLCRALRELGIDVPREVTVVGFDDLSILDYLPQGLSSVHVPKHEMGRRAAELLIEHVETRKPLTPHRILLEGRLVERAWTPEPKAAPPQAGVPVG